MDVVPLLSLLKYDMTYHFWVVLGCSKFLHILKAQHFHPSVFGPLVCGWSGFLDGYELAQTPRSFVQ
jgi:hypothetical protein